MNLKTPVMYDTSYWELIPDFALVSPRPLIVSTKATEGSSIRDPKFLQYWADLKQDGIYRQAYHFHRKAVNEAAQAQNFISTLKAGGVTNQDILELDIEEGGESATQIIAWLDLVEAAFPNNFIILYGRKNILDLIAMTPLQARRLKKYPIWTAGYPANPDLYNAPPASYIPDTTRWGEVWQWQYTDKAIVHGITGAVDANWVSPKMIAWLGVSDTTAIHSQPFPNIDEYTEVVNGVRCHISLITLDASTRFHVKHFDGALGAVSTSAADVCFNGQDYNKATNPTFPFYPQGMAYTDGVLYTLPRDFQWWLNVSPDNVITADYHSISNYYNTTSFIRPLVVNGVLHPSLYDTTKIENIEVHARSALGYVSSNKLIQIVAEGKYLDNTGVTLPQLAQLAIRYGAQFLGEHGGGGDAGKAIGGVMVNIPSDPGERAVPQVLEIFFGGSMNGTAKEALGKVPTVRNSAHVVSGNAVGTLPPGVTIQFTTIVDDVDHPGDAGYKWFQLPDGNFVNYIYQGRTYFTVLTQPTPDVPPPATQKQIIIDLAAGSVITLPDGSKITV